MSKLHLVFGGRVSDPQGTDFVDLHNLDVVGYFSPPQATNLWDKAQHALGFLGLGAQPPTPEWGTMLASAREFTKASASLEFICVPKKALMRPKFIGI